ncbi:hypothetical protein [Paraburkholderia sp. BR14320]|uniref:hypothetical protein n=1 Tax=unclassified Paraburkholderia TaxID=2615204 RepID=UPI0034CF27EC
MAAGYTADELLNPDDQSHILDRFRGEGFHKATDFFGEWGWWWIEQLREAATPKWLLPARILVAVISLAWLNHYHPVATTVLAATMLACLVGTAVFAINGVTTVKRVRNFIDVALRAKLGEAAAGPDKPLTFRDLNDRSDIPLKIVATNITDEVGEVFSYYRMRRSPPPRQVG